MVYIFVVLEAHNGDLAIRVNRDNPQRTLIRGLWFLKLFEPSIFILDDDPLLRKVLLALSCLRIWFIDFGHKVQNVVVLLRTVGYDIVVLDRLSLVGKVTR